MKIQENYYYRLDNLKDVKVIWKRYDKACIIEVGVEYPSAIVDVDRLSGIELTEKKLKLFDFNLHKDVFSIPINDSWHIIELYENADDTDNLFVGYLTNQEIEDNSSEPIFLNYINFVHQIQNLYFALTGKELVVSDAVS